MFKMGGGPKGEGCMPGVPLPLEAWVGVGIEGAPLHHTIWDEGAPPLPHNLRLARYGSGKGWEGGVEMIITIMDQEMVVVAGRYGSKAKARWQSKQRVRLAILPTLTCQACFITPTLAPTPS